jgi:hypothetical protein
VHHNPTAGPADGPWLYGHNWVCLALLMKHSLWGVLALPVLSKLYVRQKDIGKLNVRRHWEFRPKHELALQLARQAMGCLRALGSQAGFTIVVDGAYVARALLRALISDGARIVSRLRRDALLFDLPPERTGRRGRPRIYGQNRISLAKRAGRRDGWLEITYSRRDVEVARRYKSFLATSKLTGGAIRVVLLEYERGNWAAYFSTDVQMDVREVLETVADRWAIEEHFHDVKEVWGAGQQQVRNVWVERGLLASEYVALFDGRTGVLGHARGRTSGPSRPELGPSGAPSFARRPPTRNCATNAGETFFDGPTPRRRRSEISRTNPRPAQPRGIAASRLDRTQHETI